MTCFRAIQGHSGGITNNLPELMGHVLIPHDWKEFCGSQGLFLLHPIHPGERTHSRRKTKQGGTTDHLLHTSYPFGENPDEEAPSDGFTSPRKVHYHSNWKHDQDAVFFFW